MVPQSHSFARLSTWPSIVHKDIISRLGIQFHFHCRPGQLAFPNGGLAGCVFRRISLVFCSCNLLNWQKLFAINFGALLNSINSGPSSAGCMLLFISLISGRDQQIQILFKIREKKRIDRYFRPQVNCQSGAWPSRYLFERVDPILIWELNLQSMKLSQLVKMPQAQASSSSIWAENTKGLPPAPKSAKLELKAGTSTSTSTSKLWANFRRTFAICHSMSADWSCGPKMPKNGDEGTDFAYNLRLCWRRVHYGK